MYFTNTNEFRREALYFEKHGKYDVAPRGTREYKEWWSEQKRRCVEGYEVGGVKITGEHYGYLNFAQIKLTRDPRQNVFEATGGEQVVKDIALSADKVIKFPDFWDGDYNFFWAKEISRKGVTEEFYKKLELDFTAHPYAIKNGIVGGGMHLCVGKKRRGGYSYKNGYIANHRYQFEPNSISVIGAHDKKYLYPEGTMQMASNYIDFFNEHTAWKKRKITDREYHQKAGYIIIDEGIKIEKGYKSQIIAVSFMNNPGAARGKDGTLILFEEAGKFPNLIDSYMSTQPTVEDGIFVTGQMIIFGTGGGDNTYWVDFEKMFYNPQTYRLFPINNEWDEGMNGTACSFFVPEYWNMPGFIDKDGNSDKIGAKQAAEEKRENIRETAKDGKALDDHVMERPFSPSEAFSRSASSIFNTKELKDWQNYIKAKNLHNHIGLPGTIDRKGSELKFDLNRDSSRPVWDYPITKKMDTTGCVVIYHPPIKKDGNVVPGIKYTVSVDAYRFDSTTGDSIGAVYVLANSNAVMPNKGDCIVASYIGRPESQDDFNKILFDLAEYYQAEIGFESDEDGGIIDYAKRFKLLDRLAEEFELAWDETIKTKQGSKRNFGMHIGSGKENLRKRQGDIYIKDWLRQPRSKDENGNITYNYQTIYDIGLLEELIRYNPEGNFDRVSALRIAMYQQREYLYQEGNENSKKNRTKTRDFFKTRLYQ